jgi:hypothetical protein
MPSSRQSQHHTCLINALISIQLSCDKAHWISSLGSPELTRTSKVFAPYFSFVLFALMQKERKKSRAKYASTHMQSRHLAFGSGHRAALLNIISVQQLRII